MGTRIGWDAAVLFLILGWASALVCQAGTPEGALEEMATASDIDTLLKHFPAKVQNSIEKLPLAKKTSIVGQFLVAKNAESHGGQLTKTSDGRGLELINQEGELLAAVRLKETFISGPDALVELEVKERSQQWKEAMVEMRYQEGEWRMVRVGSWQGMDVESEFMPQEETTSEPNESEAISTLRMLNTSLLNYSRSYPEVGFPAGLQALSGADDQESTQDHARLLDSSFTQESPVKGGYEFRYRVIDATHYQITATPSTQSKGTKSFYTDENCVIRTTAESRPANANDPPLE
jgi:hypothetical protein